MTGLQRPYGGRSRIGHMTYRETIRPPWWLYGVLVLLCLLLVVSAALSGFARADGRAGGEAAPGIGWVNLRDLPREALETLYRLKGLITLKPN